MLPYTPYAPSSFEKMTSPTVTDMLVPPLEKDQEEEERKKNDDKDRTEPEYDLDDMVDILRVDYI